MAGTVMTHVRRRRGLVGAVVAFIVGMGIGGAGADAPSPDLAAQAVTAQASDADELAALATSIEDLEQQLTEADGTAEVLREDADQAVAEATAAAEEATAAAEGREAAEALLTSAEAQIERLDADLVAERAEVAALSAAAAEQQVSALAAAAPAPAPAPAAPAPQPDPEPVVPVQGVAAQPAASSTPYENCTAARNAGAAPVRRGDPGYGPHLDRDDDGIGCE